MDHHSDCVYRAQARRALVGFSVMSFAAGAVVAFGCCLFAVHEIHPNTGNLDRVVDLPCQNTCLV